MFDFLYTFSPTLIYGGLAVLVFGEIILLGIAFVLWRKNQSFQQKLAVFFSGKKAQDLEQVLLTQLQDTKALDQEIQELFEISNRLRDIGMKSIHKTSLLRFNPFKDVGGNQSFCVALLDGKNSGVVISSLHTREGTRVYAKPVIAGKAGNFPLTDEEQATIVEAISGKTALV
ncbi:MAG: DUF4446 family protein [Minisyncoccota bacterium]